MTLQFQMVIAPDIYILLPSKQQPSVHSHTLSRGRLRVDSPPEHIGRNGQISLENTCSRPITEVKQSLVSAGREPRVLLVMTQAGAISTHMVVSAASMGLE